MRAAISAAQPFDDLAQLKRPRPGKTRRRKELLHALGAKAVGNWIERRHRSLLQAERIYVRGKVTENAEGADHLVQLVLHGRGDHRGWRARAVFGDGAAYARAAIGACREIAPEVSEINLPRRVYGCRIFPIGIVQFFNVAKAFGIGQRVHGRCRGGQRAAKLRAALRLF